MFAKFGFFLLLFTGLSQLLFSQNIDYQIYITTPGYTSVRSYSKADFEKVKHDFRVMNGPVTITDSLCNSGKTEVRMVIGLRKFSFFVTQETPIIRLVYDRNRRIFSGAGCNFVENENFKYTPPSFKGNSLVKLPEILLADINRTIEDRSLLKKDSATVFVIEADIDENGMIHRIVPLSDTLRQYSKVIIDQIYDKAVRGWQPAMRNGIPYRALAQMTFELTKLIVYFK